MAYRRSSVVLSLLMAATILPLVRSPAPPRVIHRVISLADGGPVRAPVGFSLLGLSVPASGRAPDGARVRVSRDGVRWSRWAEVEFESDVGPDLDSHETGSRTSVPVWTGPNRFVDVRFAGRQPGGTKIHLIDPGPDPRTSLAAAEAAPAKPGIVTRAQWGADESIRKGKPSYAEPLKLAIVHHTATTDNYASSESSRIVRGIYAYHVNSNGWDDIGYNFLVDRYGRVFEGRYGGVDRSVVGAHSLGFNRNSTGIAVIGNFANSKPPEVAMQSLKRLLSWRLDQASVDPTAGTTVVSAGSSKWPAGQKVSLKTVSGHLDVGKSECPGQPLYGAMGWMRVASRNDGLPKLFDLSRSKSVITPNGDGVADGVRLTGRFSSSLAWRTDVLNPSGQVVWSVTGNGSSLSVPWWGTGSDGKPVPHATYRFRVTGKDAKGSLRTYLASFSIARWPDGTFFMVESTSSRYVLEKGKLRPLSSWQARASRYGPGEYVPVSSAITKLYPAGPVLGFREGSLVSVGGKIYVISGHKRRPTTKAVLQRKGYDTRAVMVADDAAVAPHAIGSSFTSSSDYPRGATLHSSVGTEAWMLGGDTARRFLSGRARASHLVRSVDLAGPADAKVSAGAASRAIGFRDGSLVRLSGEPTIYVISGGKRLPITSSPKTFAYMRYRSENVRTVSAAELAFHEEGPPL